MNTAANIFTFFQEQFPIYLEIRCLWCAFTAFLYHFTSTSQSAVLLWDR